MDSEEQQLAKTDAELRELLQDLFASNDLYTFDEIVDRIAVSLHFNLDIIVYVRERSWFDSNVEHLTFNFLSFEYLDGHIERFKQRSDLQIREKNALKNSYKLKESRLCRILYSADTNLNLDRVLNLIMRILVAFYLNCGARDHFRQSVSSRFVREFFRSTPTTDANDLLQYIENAIGIKATLWIPRGAMYFEPTLKLAAHELLRPYHGLQEVSSPLHRDPEFARNLRTSVLRKNQTSGTATSGAQYVINTFLTNRIFAKEGQPWTSYKVRQQAVAVFESLSTERIPLDSVFHACQVIEKYLEAVDDVRTTSMFLEADTKCLAQETAIAEAPIATVASFYKLFTSTLTPAVDQLASLVQADAIAVWLSDPFSGALTSKVTRTYGKTFSVDDTATPVLISDTDRIAAECFRSKSSVSLSHPDWISASLGKLDTVPVWDQYNRRSKLEADKLRRKEHTNFGKSQECAAIAVPIHRGKIVVGVVELVSTEVGEITIDTLLLESFAAMCGGVLRRLELANDRAWLARMSYIHASRHKVENLLREIEGLGEAGRELADVIGRRGGTEEFRGLGHEVKNRSADRITTYLGTVCEAAEADAWVNRFLTTTESLRPDDISFECLADAIETLISNHSHSDFILDALKIRLLDRGPKFAQHLELRYEPPDVWIGDEKVSRIGLSPIPSDTSRTFHIGLFLLSAQVRMLGGFVQSRQEFNDIGAGAFGLAFHIPTDSRRERDEIHSDIN